MIELGPGLNGWDLQSSKRGQSYNPGPGILGTKRRQIFGSIRVWLLTGKPVQN